MNTLYNFLRDEQGQDLVEYTLLLAFVALASAGIFISAQGSINQIWTTAQTTLDNAAGQAAAGGGGN
jgi:Flp pilus assembly pilin Flp